MERVRVHFVIYFPYYQFFWLSFICLIYFPPLVIGWRGTRKRNWIWVPTRCKSNIFIILPMYFCFVILLHILWPMCFIYTDVLFMSNFDIIFFFYLANLRRHFWDCYHCALSLDVGVSWQAWWVISYFVSWKT